MRPLHCIAILLLASLLYAGCAPAERHDWENPAVFAVNKEAPHATLFPYEDADLALANDRTQSARFLSLNGTWKFNWVRKPADRCIPVMSHMGFKYEPVGKNWWVELHADVFSKADRLSMGNRSDNRIPENGTSGFGVFGIRGGARFLDDRLTVSGAVENIANEDYRIHGSGQNMPGTNFILSLKYDW